MHHTEVDWIAVYADYKDGLKPVRLIAREQGTKESTIRARAINEGWVRDLGERVKLKREVIHSAQHIGELAHRAQCASDELDVLVNNANERKGRNNAGIERLEDAIVDFRANVQAEVLRVEALSITNISIARDGLLKRINDLLLTDEEIDITKYSLALQNITNVSEKTWNAMRRNAGINDNANGDADGKNDIKIIKRIVVDDAVGD